MADKFPQIASPTAFHKKTIIVNGACGTLGSALTSALSASGANLILNDTKAYAIQEITAYLNSMGHNVRGYSFASPSTAGEELVRKAVKEFGGVHGVVNAALAPVPFKPFEELGDAEFVSSFENLVLGPLNLIRAAWPHFRAQKYGRVVNFTSDSILGMPTGSIYTTTKGALFGVNKTLAAEGAPHNIKINCVSPLAHRPEAEPMISYFSDEVKEAFRTRYTAPANVPMILALLSEGCGVSGEVFQTAGWAVSRSVWGTVEGEAGMETMEECLARMGAVCEKGGREMFEPKGMAEYWAFQVKYAGRKS